MAPPPDLLPLFVGPLNRLGLDYMVTGSVASMAYGEPRLTLGVDLVIELPASAVAGFVDAFPAEAFYCPFAEVIQAEIARGTHGHFNVIHTSTGFKADFYPVGCDPLPVWGMARRRPIAFAGETVQLAPPEYVIVRKLEYLREGGSEKHLRDISAMLRVSGALIDTTVLREWVTRLGLAAEWERVTRAGPGSDPAQRPL